MTADNWHDPEFAAGWDEAGNLYTNPDRRRQLSLLADLLAAAAPKQLLDLGIGSAQVEAALERHHPGFLERCQVTGIDASESMLALARRRCTEENLPAITLMQADFAGLAEVEVNTAPEAVICVQALHEVSHPVKQSVFARVRELLAPGGQFYILDRFTYPEGDWLEHWRATWNWMRSEVNEPVLDFAAYHEGYRAKGDHVASLEDYRDWLSRAGFETTCPYYCFNRGLIVARWRPACHPGSSLSRLTIRRRDGKRRNCAG